MSNRIFITGDRRTPSVLATALAGMAVVSAAGDVTVNGDAEPIEWLTGDNEGLEAGVRDLLKVVGANVTVIETPRNDENKPDWDARHQAVKAADVSNVVFVHVEPDASSIGRSLMNVFEEDGTVGVSLLLPPGIG